MRVAFLGLGLIGGSIARALRSADPDRGRWQIAAWTPVGDGPRRALAAGIIDEASAGPDGAIAGAALVILAAPPMSCATLATWLGGEGRVALAAGATVTDVASTKAALTAAARAAAIPFVGGHPMAGREVSGFGAADPELFIGRPWVITEAVCGGDPALVRDLALACGAVPVELDAVRHDRLVASISHLPLLASVALVEAAAGTAAEPAHDWEAAARLAASGWHDTTRLARGDTLMGAEIAASNAPAIAAALRTYRDRIDAWITALEEPDGPDAAALQARLAAARDRLRETR